MVHLNLRVDVQHGIAPDPRYHAGHGRCCFVAPLVELGVHGGDAGDGGVDVREVLEDLECEVTDGDAQGAAQVLAHDFGLL